MKLETKRRRFFLLSMAVSAGLSAARESAAGTWAGVPGGSYSDTTAWTPNYVPPTGEAIITNQPQFTALTNCNFDWSSYDATHSFLSDLVIAANESGSTFTSNTAIARLTQATTGDNMFATTETLARFGGPGQYVQSAATNSTTNITVGFGYAALYSLSSTGLLSVSGTENIGSQNSGGSTFVQSGGTHTLSSTGLNTGLIVGAAVFNSAATYNLSAGTLSSSNEYIAFGDNIDNCSGQFNQTGGSNTASFLSMGVKNHATANYALSGGTLSAGTIDIGEASIATFTATGGVLTVGATGIFIGNGSGSTGTFNLAPGSSTTPTVHVNSDIDVGNAGAGTLTQSAGLLTVSGGTYMAVGPTATATFQLIGGTFQDNYGVIGYSGNATFTQSGGTHSTNGLLLAEFSNSNGTINLSSSAVLTSTAEETLGYQGNATFNQSGGTNSAPTIYAGGGSFGGASTATAIYNLSGGTVSTTTSTTIGNQSPATFNQTGGTHTSANLYIANLAGVSGTYLLSNSGSALTTSSSVYVGYNGPGTFTQSGGTNTINGTLANGLYLGYSTGASGVYTLNSGALKVASNTDIGVASSAVFFNNGGDHSTLSFYLGISPGVTGVYNMTAGSLTSIGGSQFSYQMVGYGGSGMVNQHGGTNTLGTALLPVNLYLGYQSAAVGTYNMDELSGTSKLVVNGEAHIGEGSGASGTFNLLAGTMSVSGALVIANASSTGKFAMSGGLLTVSGQTSGTGSFTQTGGTASVAQVAMTGPIGVSNPSATFSLTQGSAHNSAGPLSITNALVSFNTSSRSTLAVPSLTLSGSAGAWTGKLDLGGNDLIVASGDLATTSNQIKTGFNSGTWSGNGISSTVAANDAGHLTALGVIRNNNGTGARLYGNSTPGGLFDGTDPALNSILVKYTYFGDANLDGQVNGTDYSLIDFAYTHPSTLTGWQNGDFNYDGKIDGSDYSLLDNTFNRQGTLLTSTPATLLATPSSLTTPTSVPEPTTFLGVAITTFATLPRRRRK